MKISAEADMFKVSDDLNYVFGRLDFLLGVDGLNIDRLDLQSPSSKYWKENIAIARENLAFGDGQTIGIIDTGFDDRYAKPLKIDVRNSIDLTGEGLHNHSGHGTIVGALANAVAPKARQIHVKALGKKGITRLQFIERLRHAVAHLEDLKVDIVNISINGTTDLDTYDYDVRPKLLCYCPVCEILTSFVRRTGISVFVSEGNLKTGKRTLGSWSCPTAAPYVTPVFAYGRHGALYDTNTIDSFGMLVPGEIVLTPYRYTIGQRLVKFFGFRKTGSLIVGSSFATPLAAGTLAVARSLLLPLKYERPCAPPRNHEEDDKERVAKHDFPLDLLLFHHDPAGEFDRRAEWYLLFHYGTEAADRLMSEGNIEDSGLLCCAVASWMKNSLCYITEQRRAITVYMYAMGLFLRGIKTLLRTEFAIRSELYIERAEQLCLDMRAKGFVPEAEKEIQDLKAYFRAHSFEFFMRIGTPY